MTKNEKEFVWFLLYVCSDPALHIGRFGPWLSIKLKRLQEHYQRRVFGPKWNMHE